METMSTSTIRLMIQQSVQESCNFMRKVEDRVLYCARKEGLYSALDCSELMNTIYTGEVT